MKSDRDSSRLYISERKDISELKEDILFLAYRLRDLHVIVYEAELMQICWEVVGDCIKRLEAIDAELMRAAAEKERRAFEEAYDALMAACGMTMH